MTNPTRQEQAAFEDKLIEGAERISKKSMSEFINIPTGEDLIPRKEVDSWIDAKIYENFCESLDDGNAQWEQSLLLREKQVYEELKEKISQIESVNGWIAFDDEPPKDGADIVCTDFTSYATAEVDDGDLIFEYECDIEFTHYMPLPPPPII